MRKVFGAFAVLATCVVVGATVSVAMAATPAGQICPAGDSGKIDVSGENVTLTLTAPAGKLISGYCVKAGSANQGCGAVSFTVSPPAASVTITGTCGKAISHYSVTYVDAPHDPPPPPHDPPPPPHDPPPPPPDDHHDPGVPPPPPLP
jgi:hypothetical protein